MFVDGALKGANDCVEGRSRREDLADAEGLERGNVAVRDDAAAEDRHVAKVGAAEGVENSGEEDVVGAGEERQANGVDILLGGGGGDFVGRAADARVDDLETGVRERPRDDFGAAIVAVETWFADEDSAFLAWLHGMAPGRGKKGAQARSAGRKSPERARGILSVRLSAGPTARAVRAGERGGGEGAGERCGAFGRSCARRPRRLEARAIHWRAFEACPRSDEKP